MSKSQQQDQFIDDDEEEVCPLCVEELDLTDKGFRPCPCGYQICQFCYNNVKNNMNGLCPACRRPYDDANIIYKPITPEEQAAYKARQAQKQKKTQAALQKEKQKAEADNLSRKHLAGLRVVQKNLVYVTGLSPNFQEDKLLQTLRGDEYFGQYGKIIKIVVSKAKDITSPQSVGVYVTYERKDDAATCIATVNGAKNGDRTLRAQFGTTKYCSAYLRGESCSNRQCMFLHEAGEANESYSRADLSALNAGSSQGSGRQPPPQSQQPLASASASQPMARHPSSDRAESPSLERPALPSTASWASRPSNIMPARPESRSTNETVDSPAPVHATPAPTSAEQVQEPAQDTASTVKDQVVRPVKSKPQPLRQELSPLAALLKHFTFDDLKFTFSMSSIPEADRSIVESYPPLFDKNGGARRRLRRREEEEQRRAKESMQEFTQPLSLDTDDNTQLGGSLQLGGEPEDRAALNQPPSTIQPPGSEGTLDQRFKFGGVPSPAADGPALTPQQQQQLSLLNAQGGSYLNSNQPTSFQQPSHPPGHQRNASRYSFANDSSASTSVKPVANPKLLSQQSSIMPPTGHSHFATQHQTSGSQFYTSNVQGPPPGLRASGTPPVSGGMTFGQGHGFATGGLQYGANASGRNANEEMMRNLLRTRGDTGGDAASKRDSDFPPLGPPSRQQSISSLGRSTPPVPPGFEGHGKIQIGERRATPSTPPGIVKPTSALEQVSTPADADPPSAARLDTAKPPSAVPTDLEGGGSRPSSRASVRRATSHVVPAVPLRPATPVRAVSSKIDARVPGKAGQEIETPTKASKAAPIREATSTTADETAVKESVPGPGTSVLTPKAEDSRDSAAQEADVAQDRVGGPNTDTAVPSPAHQSTTSASNPGHKSAPKATQPAAKGQATVEASNARAAPVTPSKPEPLKSESQKRKLPPGKLDIAAAVKDNETSSSATAISASAQSKDVKDVPPLSATSKVESAGVASPAVKSAPKTLRVVATPKAETPPSGVIISKEPVPPVPPTPASKLPSRKPSVASINPPGTPSSEHVSISDNLSLTSTSQSRANSPPSAAGGSNRVGSAPVRAKTKSQLKKERQERARAIEEEKPKSDEPITPIVPEEPAQEAIISRKKKTKKEKEPKVKPKAPTRSTSTAAVPAPEESTPTPSRPSTPQQVPVTPTPKVEAPPKEIKAPKASTPIKAQPPHIQLTGEPSPPPTPTLNPAQLIAELRAQTPEFQKCVESFLRSPTSNHLKSSQPISARDIATFKQEFNIELTQHEVHALLGKQIPAVRYGGEGGRTWDRGMVTPAGAHLRALTQELELRFLELEKAVNELPDELKFRPTKPQNDVKFPYIDLEGLKRKFENIGGRGVSVMEQMVQDGSSMKKGAFLVDEATKYINEFVMPPATPPPSATGAGPTGAKAMQQQLQPIAGEHAVVVNVNPDIAEKQLSEARRVAEERDGQLKKAIKKNKKIAGLG